MFYKKGKFVVALGALCPHTHALARASCGIDIFGSGLSTAIVLGSSKRSGIRLKSNSNVWPNGCWVVAQSSMSSHLNSGFRNRPRLLKCSS